MAQLLDLSGTQQFRIPKYQRFLAVTICLALGGVGIITIMGGPASIGHHPRTDITGTPLAIGIGVIMTVISIVALLNILPGVFYSGPTIAVAKEGLNMEIAGHLELVDWNNIVCATIVLYSRSYVSFSNDDTANYGNRSRKLRIQLFDRDLFYAALQQKYGRIPFSIWVTYFFAKSNAPFDFSADYFKDVTGEEVLNSINNALAEYHRMNPTERSPVATC